MYYNTVYIILFLDTEADMDDRGLKPPVYISDPS